MDSAWSPSTPAPPAPEPPPSRRTAKPLRPGIIYRDNRATAEATQIRERFGDQHLHALTGHLPAAFHVAAKIAWIRAHEPDVFNATRLWAQPSDYVALALTGEPALWNQIKADVTGIPAVRIPGDSTAAGTALLARHGLRADTVFTGLAAYSLNLLMHPDAEYRAAARRWYKRVIDLTVQLGATAAGGHVGSLTVPDAADPATRAQRWAGLREHLAELAAYAHQRGLDHLLVENLVTDREPSTISSIKNILAERSVVHAPVQLCLDLGHPFVSGGSPADCDPHAWLARFGPRIAEVQLPFGVNILWDAQASLAVARATGAAFIREVLTGVYESDLGLIAPALGELAGYQAAIGAADVALFGNITPEFSSSIGSRTVAERARSASFLGVDAILVSGPQAGCR